MRITPTHFALGLLVSITLMGCAELPHDDLDRMKQIPMPQVKGELTSQGAAQWPSTQWWRAYNDTQLNRLIEQALSHSPDMAIARARVDQARALAGVAQSATLPQATVDVSLTSAQQSGNYLFPPGAVPKGWNGYGQGTLGFQWDLDFWGLHKAQIAAATSDMLAAQAEHSQAQITLASAIASQYAELARLYHARDNAQARLALRQRFDQLTQHRIAQGLELSSTLNNAKSQTLQIEAEVIDTRDQIEVTQRKIVVLAGLPLTQASSLERPQLSFETPLNVPEQISLQLLGRRPDIVAARMQVEGQLKRVDQAQASFYPNINLTGYIGYQSLGIHRLIQDGSHFGSIGPAVSLPIFTAGRLKNELRFGIARYEEAVATYDKTLQQSLQEVSDSASGLQSANEQKHKLQDMVTQRKAAYTTVRQRERAGLNSEMDVLLSQEAMLSTQKNLNDMSAKAMAMDIQLKHALGGGYDTVAR